MVNICIADGTSLSVEKGTTIGQIAQRLREKLSGEPLAAKMNGTLVDLSHEVSESRLVEIITTETPGSLDILRHSAAHVMAAAVRHLYPDVKFGTGPARETGFYYDFDLPARLSEDDLSKIEAEMREIIRQDPPFERVEVARDEGLRLMESARQDYKVELLREIPEETVSLYRLADFVDLCRGPHLPRAGMVGAFRLLTVAGSYWRGDERRPMLQRIYGTAFFTKGALEKHLALVEEAKKRDHRRLGQELDLFSFHEEGPGFAFLHPKGMVIYNALVDYWRMKHLLAGYGEVRTPIVLSESLWERSGHWEHYKDNMYFTEIDEARYAIKPMNCPGALLIYKSTPKSYRDLPLRLAELGLVHRHEKRGVLHGLQRVRQFTQDDAHIFCTPEQLEDEVVGVIHLVEELYHDVGFDDYRVELSTRPWKHIGTAEEWEEATRKLEAALSSRGLEYDVSEGEGAFYGPKIDFHVRDSLARTWQCATIQVDFSMPKRFGLEYAGPDNCPHTPVMIHRAIYGSIERFMANLLEHYGGALPVWLSPEQVRVIPVSEPHLDYARKVERRLKDSGIRVFLDDTSEKVGHKVREATLLKVPYMLIVGGREASEETVSVRKRTTGDVGSRPLEEFCKAIQKEAKSVNSEGG